MTSTVPRTKASALLAAAAARIEPAPFLPTRKESDLWPAAEDVEANFRPTPRLRWCNSHSGKSVNLQQLWVSDDGKKERWLIVPTVKPV